MIELPRPDGTMTVTYGIDRRAKVPMWDEQSMRRYAAAAQAQTLAAMRRVIEDWDQWDESTLDNHMAPSIEPLRDLIKELEKAK